MSVESLVGRRIADRYEVLELVGRGAMGEVYAATQLSTGRRCALKILRSELLVNAHVMARFEREAQLAAQLTHPNTVVVYDSGRDGDRMFIAMELLEGCSLESEIRAGPFSPVRAVLVAAQICESLSEAHRAGIVHRDLKPNNILLVDRAGNADFVKVCDFGIARQYEAGAAKSGLTTDGLVYGTPSYMSPEQLRGHALDGRSDVYALGVILYEMLSKNPPFTADSVIELANKHLVEDPPWFAAWRVTPPVPDELESVVRRAMAKLVVDRWSSMDEMRDALVESVPEAMLEARSSLSGPMRRPRTNPPAPPGGASGRTAASAASGVAPMVPSTPVTERRRPGRLPVGLLAVVIATLLVGAGAGAAVLLGTRFAAEHGPSPVPPGVEVKPGVVRADHDRDHDDEGEPSKGARDGDARGERDEADPGRGGDGKTSPATGSAAGSAASAGTGDAPLPAPASAPASSPATPPGRLTLSVKPWANVYEGKRHLGMTPLESIPLRAGKHVLTLVNEKLGAKRTITVNLRAGEELKHPLVNLSDAPPPPAP